MTDSPYSITESGFSTPPSKKNGRSRWAVGCFSTLLGLSLLTVGGLAGFWHTLKNAGPFSDKVVTWSYQHLAKPNIANRLPDSWTEEKKQSFLTMTDTTLQDYLALPQAEKRLLLEEAFHAAYALSQNQVLPPGALTHLLPFIESHWERFQEASDPSPY